MLFVVIILLLVSGVFLYRWVSQEFEQLNRRMEMAEAEVSGLKSELSQRNP